MTATDNTWAVRVEAPGLEDVVTGPLTRTQADVLAGMYLDQDRDDAAEGERPTRRRITVEAFDPADPDLEPVIPKGAELTWWPGVALLTAVGVALAYLAAHTFGLQFVTPRPRDTPIAVLLTAGGALLLYFCVGAVVDSAWRRFMRRWTRSSRRRPAEVTS